jgi:hypothetical protein
MFFQPYSSHTLLLNPSSQLGSTGVCLSPKRRMYFQRPADCALGLIGSVVGDLGEHFVIDLVRIAAYDWQHRLSFEPCRMRNSGQIAKRRVNIQVRNQSVNDLAAGEAAGPRVISETPQPLSSRLHFMREKATP